MSNTVEFFVPGLPKTAELRFSGRVSIASETGCWIWTGAKDRDGYGRFWIGGKTKRAHRVSYEAFKGPIPGDLELLHSCDNPSCVNPEHLSAGTSKDNSQDMMRKGRHVWTLHPEKCPRGDAHHWRRHPDRVIRLPGELNPNAKLKADQVVEIRARYAAGGVTYAALGGDYRITATLACAIVKRRAWRHL